MKRHARDSDLDQKLRDLALQSPERRSLADFKKNTRRFRKQLRESGRPVYLTARGKSAIVVQDVAAYARLMEAAEVAGTIRAIAEGLADSKAGRSRSFEEFDREMRRRHKLPRRS